MLEGFNSLLFFMINIPYFFIFIFIIALGRFMSLSSNRWIYVWMGIEINLLSFIPLIISGINELEVERGLKYFLVQSLGSSLILFSYFRLIGCWYFLLSKEISIYLLYLRLILKLGIFPFHFWLPQVISGVNWFCCGLLMVWQKVSILLLLRCISYKIRFIMLLFLGRVGSLVGGVGGVNQTQIRVLLAYSSIGHIGWMLCRIIFSFGTLFIYFLIYRLINFIVVIFITWYPLNRVNIAVYLKISLDLFICLGFLFLSLGGLPPFLGFFSKYLVIVQICANRYKVFLLVLLCGSLINIFYYLNIFFNILIKRIFFFSKFNNLYSFRIYTYRYRVLMIFSIFGLILIYVIL